MGKLTDDSALVAVDGSRSGDVLFDDIEAHHGRRGVGSVGREIADAQQDLPRKQVGEERWRRRKRRVLREERPHALSERAGRRRLARRWERQEVAEVGRHSPLHPLHRTPIYDHSASDLGLSVTDLHRKSFVLCFRSGNQQIWGFVLTRSRQKNTNIYRVY